MKVVYTQAALDDLDHILRFIAARFPLAYDGFANRLRSIERRVAQWPYSAREVAERPAGPVAPMVRYPYKIFYRVTTDAVEILHVWHGAQQEPANGST